LGDDERTGWDDYEKMVIHMLEENRSGVNRLTEEVQEMREEQAILSQNTEAITRLQDRVGEMEKKQIKLQVKAGLIGAMATLLGSGVVGILIKVLVS